MYKRGRYLKKLIAKKNNGMIKVVTGIRRCGKSYLLFKIFKQHLLDSGVSPDHIIELALDDFANKTYRTPDALYAFVMSRVVDGGTHYVLLDEVQYVDGFEDVLNGFLHISALDVYVTGSNSKFLSSDIITEFRGRGDEVRVYPLTYSEFLEGYSGDPRSAFSEYMYYGGLPAVCLYNNHGEKEQYLRTVFQKVYLTDLVERNKISHVPEFSELVSVLASDIGGLTNPNKLEKTFRSGKNTKMPASVISSDIDALLDAFIISKAMRYDVKGRKYISTPCKYYFTDLGIRNSILDYRQQEETHLMENAIYNELLVRGFSVDVGFVECYYKNSGNRTARKNLEIDFVCNRGSQRYYIQSALTVADPAKMEQEQCSLIRVEDSFKKFIIVKDPTMLWRSEKGITIMDVEEFLSKANSLEL